MRSSNRSLVFLCSSDHLFHLVHDSDIGGIVANTNFQESVLAADLSQEHHARAIKANQLHGAMNHPSDEALGKLLDNGNLLDCPLTSIDLHNARVIFGPCSKCIADKTANHSNPSST